MLKRMKKIFQHKYVMNHVKNATIPQFSPSEIKRQHFIFTGKVQGVGFRVEIFGIAQRIGLTGWVRNNDDLSVEAELQGERDKIEYLVQFMKDLKRANVEGVSIEERSIIEGEQKFELRM